MFLQKIPENHNINDLVNKINHRIDMMFAQENIKDIYSLHERNVISPTAKTIKAHLQLRNFLGIDTLNYILSLK